MTKVMELEQLIFLDIYKCIRVKLSSFPYFCIDKVSDLIKLKPIFINDYCKYHRDNNKNIMKIEDFKLINNIFDIAFKIYIKSVFLKSWCVLSCHLWEKKEIK